YLQVGMLMLLLQLQVLNFRGLRLSSLAANLFAVPLVTFILVPLILLGLFLHLFPVAPLVRIVWLPADKSLAGLFWLLMGLPYG
ncbi:ComEC/Rec2 family competence protein, partial [Enterobacter hormaechei]|uniref:ComEC/Rec2 family competence protein n=1 Tax=Enterobacter hormaechei TaxID=158836 RepID=UPI001920C5E1